MLDKVNIGFSKDVKVGRFTIPVGIDWWPKEKIFHIWHYERNGRNSSGAGYQPSEAMNKTQRFKDIGAEWFIPYIERMANGEDVPLEEIKQAYRDNNDGREIEEVT